MLLANRAETSRSSCPGPDRVLPGAVAELPAALSSSTAQPLGTDLGSLPGEPAPAWVLLETSTCSTGCSGYLAQLVLLEPSPVSHFFVPPCLWHFLPFVKDVLTEAPPALLMCSAVFCGKSVAGQRGKIAGGGLKVTFSYCIWMARGRWVQTSPGKSQGQWQSSVPPAPQGHRKLTLHLGHRAEGAFAPASTSQWYEGLALARQQAHKNRRDRLWLTDPPDCKATGASRGA